MRRLIIIIGVVFSTTFGHGQINELGLFVGGSNHIGDLGRDNYIAPNRMAIGGLYKWNRSKRHSYRFGLTYAEIFADDKQSSSPERTQRGLKAENYLLEVSAGLEFNFLNFDLHQYGFKWTPYVFGGISYFGYNETYFAGTLQKGRYRSSSIAFPMVLGIKANINENWIIGAEVGTRYTLIDNIDGNKPRDLKSNWFSNINSNDWFVFTGVTLTYTFGENPCFCPGE